MDPIEALRIRGIGGGKKPTGNALPADVRVGKTFSTTAGYDLSGTLSVRSTVAQTVTPTTLNIVKTAGIYDGDITIQGEPNLVAANIINGKSIFGVAGNFIGKRYASGSGNTGTGFMLTVSGLLFQPSIILATLSTNRATGIEYVQSFLDGQYILYQSSGATTTKFTNANGGYINNGAFSLNVPVNGTFSWMAFE